LSQGGRNLAVGVSIEGARKPYGERAISNSRGSEDKKKRTFRRGFLGGSGVDL